MTPALKEILTEIHRFVRDRRWTSFHSPKNLAIALTVEAAELAENFQWLKEEDSRRPDPEVLDRVAEEIGDVTIYLLELSDRLGIDPLDAALNKIAKNRERYPVGAADSRLAASDRNALAINQKQLSFSLGTSEALPEQAE